MNKKRLIFGFLTFIWCLVIFSFSNATGNSSGSLSLKITHFVLSLFFPSFYELDILIQTNILEIMHLLIRKLAHMSEYAILYFFIYQYISTYQLILIKTYIYPLVFSVFYAMFDEFHQLFIDGRAGSIVDIGIDSLGALCMLLLIYIIEKILLKYKKVH